MKYQSTKTYGAERGLSCCFRQPNARGHCSMLHGYALSFTFVFEAETLDDRNWVMDFGGLKELEEKLRYLFDHTLVADKNDYASINFENLGMARIANVRFIDGVGCEKFAEHAYKMAEEIVNHAYLKQLTDDIKAKQRVRVVSCECAEHGANSAIYYGDN